MATWSTIPDASLLPGSPARSIDALSLRDNPIAIAEGASGAPKVETAAIDINASLEATARDYTFGAIGTHALLWRNVVNSPIVAGNNYAGSSLRPAGISSPVTAIGFGSIYINMGLNSNILLGGDTSVATVSGTWKALGATTLNSSDADYPVTLFVRIA